MYNKYLEKVALNLKALAYMRRGRKSYKELAKMYNVVQKIKRK